MSKLKSVIGAGLLASTALTTPVSAQSSVPLFVQGSSSSSAPGIFLIPAAIAVGLGRVLGDYQMQDVLTQELLATGASHYYDLILYWTIANSVASLTFFQAGYYYQNGDVDTVTQPGGAVFNTTGPMSEHGFFVGLGALLYLNQLARRNRVEVRRADTTTQGEGIALTGALSIGLGQQEFSAFGGGFTQDQSNLFVRAEVGLEIPIGSSNGGMDISLNPGLVFTQYSGGAISADNLVGVLRLKIDF